MKRWLVLVLLCVAWAARGDDLERARQIHKDAIGIDSHIDTIQWVIHEDADLAKRNSVYNVDFPRLHARTVFCVLRAGVLSIRLLVSHPMVDVRNKVARIRRD
jgi:hypothetical protein